MSGDRQRSAVFDELSYISCPSIGIRNEPAFAVEQI